MHVTHVPSASESATVARHGGEIYGQITRRKTLILIGLILALGLSVLVDIGWGPARLTPVEVLRAIFTPDAVSRTNHVIVWEIRLPVALLALLVGCSLGIAGSGMQTILNNPLADPYTLGISAAASLGAALGIIMNIRVFPWSGELTVTINAFIMATAASLAIYGLSTLRGVTTQTMILFGICLMFAFGAVNGMLQYIASEEALQQFVYWTMGSLQRASWGKLAIISVVLAFVAQFMARNVWKLTMLRMGDDRARALGVDVPRLRLSVLLLVSLATSVAVAFCGTIGFVGLVGPHIARMLVGEDQRYFMPTAAITSGLLLSLASIASKTLIPGTLIPIGIITSLVGVPFFLSLILSRRSTTGM
ncbi:MAG: iron ABC transporter permease [Thermomicrobiales bacterium]|nr:iron ABC transporter permease [Thermomicrobiales bacterium]